MFLFALQSWHKPRLNHDVYTRYNEYRLGSYRIDIPCSWRIGQGGERHPMLAYLPCKLDQGQYIRLQTAYGYDNHTCNLPRALLSHVLAYPQLEAFFRLSISRFM